MDLAANVLVVMAKYPAPGSVKTRLAREVGAERTCRLYRAFLCDISWRFGRGPHQLVWAVDPPGSDLTPVVGMASPSIDQRGRDLGERMRRCFEDLCGGGVKRAVMIGADAPHLADAVIDAAFAALGSNDVTLVPSSDGGYCLVGMSSPHDIFSGIAMSTPRVFEQTRLRIRSLGLRLHAHAPSFDVDEMEDVAALEAELSKGRVRLPNTARILRQWRREGVLASLIPPSSGRR